VAGVPIKAMSHITGGGIPGNLPRVLPEGLGLRIGARWSRAPVALGEVVRVPADRPFEERVEWPT
jgi:phosphoribosylformylglycinamidine cyclo-ligase